MELNNKKTNEVSSVLMGGLGNYMFQVAVAYAYGKKFNKYVAFNYAEASGDHNHVTTYKDNVFKGIDLYHPYKGPGRLVVREIGFHYQEIPDYQNKDIVFYGYYQSEKHFKDYEEDIRKLFMSYDVTMDDENSEIFKNENTCSIHIRRGDYLKLLNHHPTQSMDYYMMGIEKMPKDSVFLIFSDDIEWCKNNFPNNPDKFKFMEGNTDYEDLFMMSICKNNIICNSSFSWWGAWLNKNPEKIVVAPNLWFGPAKSNFETKDIYCDDWIKL